MSTRAPIEVSPARLLAAWESGRDRHPAVRPVSLLAATTGDSEQDLAALSLGRRELLLLRLRELAFGSRVTALAACPDCAEQVELALPLDDMRRDLPIGTDTRGTAQEADVAGYLVAFRLPDSADAAAAAAGGDVPAARRILVDRCLAAATGPDGDAVPAVDLPSGVVSAVAELMAELDPYADVRVCLTCPTCEASWDAPLDAGALLWTELDAWARRTLCQVHELALAYGWSEADSLALSERRRLAYLDLVGS